MKNGDDASVPRAMKLLKTLRPVAPISCPAPFVRVAVDLRRSEPERVAAVRLLHGSVHAGYGARADVARSLVDCLNEPLLWLPLEALSLMALLGVRIMLGVKHGRIVASPTRIGRFVSDAAGNVYCADLGRVVIPRRLAELARRIEKPAWL